jgi:hypothetical protein
MSRDPIKGNQPDQIPNARPASQESTEIPDPETTQSMDPFTMQTQKGQAKEDGDPSQECDQSLENQDIRL